MNYLFLAAVLGIVACHGGGGFGGSFGGRGSRTGGGSESNEDFGGRHHHRLEPSFLRGLNRTAKEEFFAIGRKDNETITQQKQDVLAWAEKYNLTEQVKQFDANLTAYRAELAQNVSDLIANLPTIQNQIQTIFKNEDQTRKQLWNALEELKNSSRKEVDVLFFIASRFRKHGKGPRGGEGPFPGPFTGGNFGGPGGAGGQGGQFGGRGGPRGGPQGGPQNFGGFGNGQQGFGGQPGFGGNQGFRGGPQQQTIGRGAAPFGGNSFNNNNNNNNEEDENAF